MDALFKIWMLQSIASGQILLELHSLPKNFTPCLELCDSSSHIHHFVEVYRMFVSWCLIPWFSQNCAKSCELYSSPSSVRSACFKLPTSFSTSTLKFLKVIKSSDFFYKKIYPCSSAINVNERNKLSFTSIRCRSYWPTNIWMD